MSTLAENALFHPPNRREITQSLDPITDSGQEDTQLEHSSEDSNDSLEESLPTTLYPPNCNKRRNKYKARSVSETSYHNDELRFPLHRGILKYQGNNRLRSLSESCVENYSDSPSNHGESLSALDECWDGEADLDEDGEEGGSKVKKTVRFSDKVHKQLFRSNSSILGQRKKNQRRSNKKKIRASKRAASEGNGAPAAPPSLSSSAESECVDYSAHLSDAIESVMLSDSGVDASDSDPCADGAFSNSLPPKSSRSTKKNKKKANKGHRQRTVSEPTNGDMIFDFDL